MRDSAGISPDFAHVRNPGCKPGRGVNTSRPLDSFRWQASERHGHRSVIVSPMKRLIPVLLTAAAAAVAVATLKLLEDHPLPEPPLGRWELDDDRDKA